MLEDVIPALESVERTLQKDGAEFRDRLSNIEACLRNLATNSGVNISNLNLRPPPVPTFNASSPRAVSSPSLVSTPSSTTAPQISALSIEEAPEAGPSRISHKAAETQGMFSCTIHTYYIYN